MSIKNIEAEELREMNGKEGLIIQGCGGPLQEWLDGINEMLTEAGILQNGSKFTDVYVFQNEDVINILFSLEGVDLNMGKLAAWRLQTHGQFYGTWLSDYVTNQLGGFIEESKEIIEDQISLNMNGDKLEIFVDDKLTAEISDGRADMDFALEVLEGMGYTVISDKPDCALIGEDGNVFNLIGIASRTLKKHGLGDQAKEMSSRVFACGSYNEALCIIGEYVNITDSEHVREYRPSVVKKIKETKVAEPTQKPKPHKFQER